MVFLLVLSVFNYFLFRTIRTNIISSHQQSVSVEAESLALSLRDDPTQIPLTKTDQPIQIWINSVTGSQKIYERLDFPKDYSELFLVIQNEGYATIDPTSTILEVESYTFSFSETASIQPTGTVTLVLAKDNRGTYAQIKTIGQWMVGANLGAALLSLILALIVSRFTLRPIQALINKAKSIKASEQMERLPVSSANDELTELSKTINQMIERIESSIQTQNQFFTSAAHELRTPLANMLAELEFRLSQQSAAAGDKALLESQREEVVRLKYVVQDFLLMSQLKSDTLSLHISPLRLDDLLYDVLEKMGHSIKASAFDMSIFISSQTEYLLLNGDSIKMESILVNLIQNSLKYGDSIEPVKIKIDVSKDYVTASFVNKIDFQKQVQSGNKLGLWICGQLAEKQGFNFSSTAIDTHFEAKLEIPISAHN